MLRWCIAVAVAGGAAAAAASEVCSGCRPAVTPAPAPAPTLALRWNVDDASYTLITPFGEWDGAPIGVHTGGKWYAQNQEEGVTKLRKPVLVKPVSGVDKLGTYEGTEVTWDVPVARGTSHVPFRVILANYGPTSVDSGEESAMARMTLEFPNGLPDTAQAGGGVITNFPAFASAAASNAVLSWEGSFAQPALERTYGTTGGQVICFDASVSASLPLPL
jgi:hypothetical protein